MVIAMAWIDSPQIALSNLDPERISFARELRGLTKTELAARVSKTASAISQIERGITRPELETLINIAFALQVPVTFFSQRSGTISRTPLESCHFRSKRSASQIKRIKSIRIGDLVFELVAYLHGLGVQFPQENISRFISPLTTDSEIEKIAADLRLRWGLGVGPISSMINLLERNGIFVLPIPDSCMEIDAYSTWISNSPCIMLAYNKSASRARFDAAHELGHLILHEDKDGGIKQVESQADRFASSFLLPQESFARECPRRWHLDAFLQMKQRWKVSLQALLYRAKELEILSYQAYRKAMIDISTCGYRRSEPGEPPVEYPTMIGQALEAVVGAVTTEDICSSITIKLPDIMYILRGAVPSSTWERLKPTFATGNSNIVKFTPKPR